MEGLILVIIALGALVAFFAGGVLLVLYFRSGEPEEDYEPVVYGKLVQCPACGYMNPMDSAGCLNCRRPLPRPQGYQPPAAPRPVYPPPAGGYAPPRSTPVPPAYGRPTPPPVSAATARAAPTPPAETTVSPSQQAALRPAPIPDRPAGMPHAWLEGKGGVIAGHVEVLKQEDTLVGRSTTCDVQIYDPKVSRQHFRIRYANGAFFLQDQESSRGTLVNGERVAARRLSNGDRIEAGDSTLIFHVE